jgi:hypothetical protein
MTTTAQQAEAATAVTTWLAEFSAALAANDPAGAAALFTEDCFWRDLVSFTWNITTFEGRAEITRMLAATLSRVQPAGWTVTDGEEPAETDGITEAWIGSNNSAFDICGGLAGTEAGLADAGGGDPAAGVLAAFDDDGLARLEVLNRDGGTDRHLRS